MSATAIPDTLVAAYSTTDYRVIAADAPFALRIGQRSDELARLFVLTGQQGGNLYHCRKSLQPDCHGGRECGEPGSSKKELVTLGATVLDGAGSRRAVRFEVRGV